MNGRICAVDLNPIESDHPVDWLRGKVTLTLAMDPADLPSVRTATIVSVHIPEQLEMEIPS